MSRLFGYCSVFDVDFEALGLNTRCCCHWPSLTEWNYPPVISGKKATSCALSVNGMAQVRNFDGYPKLRPDRMPRVHVRIAES